jgi:hypothetical protein
MNPEQYEDQQRQNRIDAEREERAAAAREVADRHARRGNAGAARTLRDLADQYDRRGGRR